MPRRLLLVCLAACQPAAVRLPAIAETHIDVAADRAFESLSARWLDESMRHSPVSATQAGDHRYDRELDEFSTEGRAASDEFNRNLLQALQRIDPAELSRANQVDYQILRNQLQAALWSSGTYQPWAWNPLLYSQLAGNSLYLLMMRDFAPLPERLNNAASRIEKLPRLFAQARANLDPARVPKVHAETGRCKTTACWASSTR